MSVPLELVLVRHGQSEANVVQQRDKRGQERHLKQSEVYGRLDAHQRLTADGRDQARRAGVWLRAQGLDPSGFGECYVSPYYRTMETAALVGPDIAWLPDIRLIERDWGAYGATPHDERDEQFPHTELMRAQSNLFVRYDGGESIIDVSHRFRDWLGSLARRHPDGRVLAVTHGEMMWTARFVLERLLPGEWEDLNGDTTQRIGNFGVLHYSRANPGNPSEVERTFSSGWVRIVNTSLDAKTPGSPYGGEWQRVAGKRRYTGAQLCALIHNAPPLLDGD